MTTVIRKYGAAIYSTLVFLLGTVAIALVQPGGFSQDNILGLIPLIVATFVMYWFPTGLGKTITELIGAVLALLVPAFFSGGEWTTTQWLMLALGVLKAGATAFGFVTRIDPALAPMRVGGTF